MSYLNCPLPAMMGTVPLTACDVDFGQVVRALIARKTSAPLFAPTSGTVAITQTTFSALLAQTGDAKAVLTPLFAGMTFPETAAVIEGENDNSTEFGAGHVSGGNVIRVKPMFTSINGATAQAMYALNSEKNLQIVFINQFNQAIIKSTGYGFRIYNQTMTDVTSDGLNKKNRTPWSFTLPYGWSLEDGYQLVQLPFDALTLVQAP